MRCDTKQHNAYCGIDLHARSLYLGILSQDGELLRHRHMKTRPAMFLKAMAPYRADLVVCVACICTWYGLAALCAQEHIPFVLGHALSMKALHGGQAKNDTIDAQQIAVLLRGGLLPQADGSPAAMRATRALLRRRTHVMRKRAELLPHIQQTNSQYPLPEIGKKIASTATRDRGAERLPEPAGQQSLDVDLALLGHYDQRLRAVELSSLTMATQHTAQTRYLLRTVPGIGEILRVGLLYDLHDLTRFPRGQDVLSSCRLGTCTKESAGQRYGTAGTQSGNAHLTWACSEAAVLLLRATPAGQKSLTTREKQHGSGKALTRWGQKRGRTVYYLLQRHTAFDLDKFLHGEGRGADEPYAALDHHGVRLRIVLCHAEVAASLHA